MARTRVAVSDTEQDAQQTMLVALAADPGLDVVSVTPADASTIDAQVLVLGSRGDHQQGARLCAAVTSVRPDLPVILIVETDRPIKVLTALAAGAHGLVSRADDADTLRNAIHHVAQGRNYIAPSLAHTMVQLAIGAHLDPTDLTPAEIATLELVVDNPSAVQRLPGCGVSP